MERRSRVHLDHPAIRGRIREPQIRRTPVQGQTDLGTRAAKLTPSPVNSTLINQNPSYVEKDQTSKLSSVKLSTKQSPIFRIRTVPITTKPGKTAHLPRQARSGVLRRQMVGPVSKQFRPKKHRSYRLVAIAGLAAFIIIVGSFFAFLRVKNLRSDTGSTQVLAKHTDAPVADRDKGTSVNDMPSEDNPPSDISNYTVSSNLPRLLIIDKLSVNARVRRVGADNDMVVKGPSSIFDAGWYENSSDPGEDGTMLVDGHVSGETKRGIFYGLNNLVKGDRVVIERGDGKRISYTVEKVEEVDFVSFDLKKAMTSSVPDKPGLNLMTATGRFNVRTNQYEKRVIVYTTQD